MVVALAMAPSALGLAMDAAPGESPDPALTAWAEYDNRYEWRLELNRSAEFPLSPEDSGERRRVVYSNSQQVVVTP